MNDFYPNEGLNYLFSASLSKKTFYNPKLSRLKSIKRTTGLLRLVMLLLALIPASMAISQTTITYSSSSTWLCPTGVNSIIVECWGGGGAGGAARGNPSAGGGGAGGSFAKNIALPVTPGVTYTITVGAGGIGSTANAVGNPGNDSWFGSAATIMAKGGNGGNTANSNNQTATGAAAISSGNVGFSLPASSYSFYGGAGGTGGAGGASGGGSGGSAGTGSNGNAATGMTGGAAVTGGGAGIDGSASSGNAANNTNLGGGGPGARTNVGTNMRGGDGGNGQVRITFTQPVCPSSTAITPIATQNLCVGGTTNLLTANITTSGTGGTPTLQYQWYYNTINSNNIGTATLLAGQTSSTYTPQNSIAGTRYYFCVGYASNNGCGQTNSTQILASNTVQVNVTASLSGTYLVGSGQAYTTLTAAVAAYNSSCLSGPVTFALTDATYSGSETFPITINNITYASSTNTLTIKPNTGVTATISGLVNNNALIRILGKYVTIDGSNNGTNSKNLDIANTSITGPSVVLIGSTGVAPITNVVLKNSVITNGVNTATAVVVSDAGTLGSAGYFNNITIQNNTIRRAYMGIYSIAVAGNGLLLTIDSNNLTASGANAIRMVGIYLQDVEGATVSNNTIGNFESASGEFDYGIWFAAGTRNSIVTGNTISNLSYTGGTFNTGPNGIFISTNTDNSNLTISNNTISNITSNGWVSGTSGAATGINVDFASSGGLITGNKISNITNTNVGGYGCNGIQLSATALDAGFTISNNFIWNIVSRGSTLSRNADRNGHGIIITTGGGYHIYNNTVVLNSNQTNSGYPSAMNIMSAVTQPASIDIVNNIFVNTQTQAGERYAIQSGAANTVFNSINFNDYFTTGTNLGYIGSNRTNLAAIQTGFGSNASSLNILPVFVSASDYHIQTSPAVNEALNNSGTPVTGISNDIDAQVRNVLTPDMGADEFRGRGSWIGITSSVWLTASNWFDNFVPLATTNVEIPGTATYMPIISSTTHPAKNIVIEAGGSITVNGSGVLQCAGSFGVNGTLDVSDGTLDLNDTAPQSIPGNTVLGNNVNNLIISNTNNVTGVTLGGTLNILRSLTFGAGGRKLTTGGFLVLRSSVTETAALGQMTASNSIVGDVTVERYIPLRPKAWQFLSTPTTGQTVNAAWQEGNTPLSTALNPGYGTIITSNVAGAGFDIVGGYAPSMKTYDTAAKAWVGIANTFIPVNNRKGYMLFVRGNRTVTTSSAPPTEVTLRTKGTLFTPANPPVTINLNANTMESVGNPYPSAIDLTAVTISGGVQDVFYVWDPKITTFPSAYGLGAIQTFTRSGGTYIVTPGGGSYPSGTSNRIESGQAFFVRAPSVSGSLTFTETCKVMGSTDVNRIPMPVVSSLRTNLYVINAGAPVLLDGNLVQFDPSFNGQVDMNDAIKLANSSENLGIKRYNEVLAVESRPVIEKADTIFYNLGQMRVKQYKLEFFPVKLEQPGMEAFLEDRYLNTSTPVSLNDTTRLMFNVVNVPGSYASDRFRLVFRLQKQKTELQPIFITAETGKNATVSTGINNGNDHTGISQLEMKTGITVYPNPVLNKVMQLQFLNQQEGTYQLQLSNNQGQILYNNTLQINGKNTMKQVSLDHYIPAGTYQLTITSSNADTRYSQQVIIR